MRYIFHELGTWDPFAPGVWRPFRAKTRNDGFLGFSLRTTPFLDRTFSSLGLRKIEEVYARNCAVGTSCKPSRSPPLDELQPIDTPNVLFAAQVIDKNGPTGARGASFGGSWTLLFDPLLH
jgi:hypothetical protein